MVDRKSSFIMATNFNLKAEPSSLTREWLEARLPLLKHITLATLAGQADQDFLYLIFVNRRCPHTTPEMWAQLEGMMLPNSILVDVPRSETTYPGKNWKLLTGEASAKIYRRFAEPDKYGMVWTTHFGTDDGFSGDFVKRMKAAYNWDIHKYQGYLSYPSGYAYDLPTDKFHYVRYEQDFFFLTRREPLDDNFRSVTYWKHTHMSKRAPVAMLDPGDPMWIKTIHVNAMSNRGRSRKIWMKYWEDQPHGRGRVNKRFSITI
jgi:hypothetical protein